MQICFRKPQQKLDKCYFSRWMFYFVVRKKKANVISISKHTTSIPAILMFGCSRILSNSRLHNGLLCSSSCAGWVMVLLVVRCVAGIDSCGWLSMSTITTPSTSSTAAACPSVLFVAVSCISCTKLHIHVGLHYVVHVHPAKLIDVRKLAFCG